MTCDERDYLQLEEEVLRYGLENEADQCVGQRRHSRQEGGRRMGLVSIKLLGQSFSSNAGDSLPGARPASSTTWRPCSGGQTGIMQYDVLCVLLIRML